MRKTEGLNKEDMFRYLSYILFFALGIASTCAFFIYLDSREVQTTSSLSACSSDDFYNTSFCLNYYVNKIYKYNITEDNIDLGFQELKSRGGDCLDWAKFYKQEFTTRGYNSQIVKIQINETTNHAFVIANDEMKYCLLDQRLIICNLNFY